MKKISFIILSLILGLAFASCKKEQPPEPDFYQISGVIYDSLGIPLPDVNVCLQDTTVQPNIFINSKTDLNGAYFCTVKPGWSGLVTPAKVNPGQQWGYTFEPNQRSYVNVHKDYLNEDYHQRKRS